MNRGDIVLVRFPHPSGVRGKKRPAVVVQSDVYTGTVGTLVVADDNSRESPPPPGAAGPSDPTRTDFHLEARPPSRPGLRRNARNRPVSGGIKAT